MAWTIGFFSIVLNCNALVRSIPTIPGRKSEAAFQNNFLIVMISFGDFLIGCYLTAIAFFDALHGKEYCQIQLDWLTSDYCVVLGATSTFGSFVSLFAMTTLSLIRVTGISNQLAIPKDRNRMTTIKLAIIAAAIIILSAAISFFPLIGWLEDIFINGIRYEQANTLFQGAPNKETHMKILEAYYGRFGKTSIILSWSQINDLVDSMFSGEYGGITKKKLTFYGNDGVCLFKFFVKQQDPQRNFVLTVLAVTFVSFFVIATSYGTIASISKKSTKELTKSEGDHTKIKTNAALHARIKNNVRLQRVTQGIILTDFVCWFPFIVISLCHVAGVLDATPWYSLFSIIFLPINSVINPVIYDKVASDFICKLYRLTKINLCVEAIIGAVKLLKTKTSHKLDKIFLSESTQQEGNESPSQGDIQSQ
jgi:hypothetical protein